MKDYNNIPITDVPPRYRDDLQQVMDTFGDEDVSLIKQDGSRGGGASSSNKAELEVHFHIGDVTNVHVHVDESEEDTQSILSRLLRGSASGGQTDGE